MCDLVNLDTERKNMDSGDGSGLEQSMELGT
jgi:hypothetical protein